MGSFSFAKRLSNLLSDSGHSQSEIARYLGIKPATVSAWITGKGTPQFEKLEPIARYFRMTVPELLSDGTPKEASSPAVSFVQTEDNLASIPPGSEVRVELRTQPEVGDIVLYNNKQLRRLAAYRAGISVLMSDDPAEAPIISKDDDQEITGTATAILLKKAKKETAPDGRSGAALVKEGNQLNSSNDIVTPSSGGVKP